MNIHHITIRSRLLVTDPGCYSITDLTFASPLLTRILNVFPAATPGENCLTLVNTETLQFLNTHLDR